MTVKGFGFFSEAFVNIIDSPKMNKKTKFCYRVYENFSVNKEFQGFLW